VLARLGGLAQFSEALAIAPRALGSARHLTAKRRTRFAPRVHYKLGTWFWWRRDHMNLDFMISMPA